MQSPTVNSNDPRRPEKIQSYRMAEVFFKNRRLLKRESKESYVYIFGRCMSGMSDERIWSPTRNNKYKAPAAGTTGAPGDDPIPDYMNVLSMIFSMCGLMMKLKWCAWVALFCSSISFANSRVNDDTKQILSSFMLSISAVVMSYLQNPQPMTLPWTS